MANIENELNLLTNLTDIKEQSTEFDEESLTKEEALREVADAVGLQRLAKLHTQITVDTARALGATWAEIAVVAGITKQTAHTRWSDKGKIYNQQKTSRIQKLAKLAA